MFEDENKQDDDNHNQVQGTPDAEEDILQLPLPVPEEGTEDKALFIQQQEEDLSLVNIRRLADQQRGYKRENGLIVHMEQDELSTYWTRVVVPKARRKNILALAHSNPMTGHCGVKKMAARLKQTFTLPGMSTNVKVVCASCLLMSEGCEE